MCNANQLISSVQKKIESGCIMEEKYKKRVDSTFVYQDKNNCKRVYEEILKLDN